MISVFDILVVAFVAGLPAQDSPSVEGPLFLAWILFTVIFVVACVLFLYGVVVFCVIPKFRGKPMGDDSADVVGRFLTTYF